MKPLFNKLFNLHLKSSNRPLEDYLTEIFAFSLNVDVTFRERFINLLDLETKNTESFYIDTQCVYTAQKRRTDLEINLGHSFVLIESKVGSKEGFNQLKDYAKLLSSKGPDFKLLVFLTANREDKVKNFPDGIRFQQLRWHDVGLCINDDCNPITKELKKFLKAQQLFMENFNYQDLVTFQSFFRTRRKLNDILRNDVCELYKKKGLFPYLVKQPIFNGDNYVLVFRYSKEVIVSIGFNNWGDHPALISKIWLSSKKDKNNEVAKAISEKLEEKHWKLITSHKDGYSVQRKERLLNFLPLEDTQRQAMVNFFVDCIEDLSYIKSMHPKIFNAPEKKTEVVEAEDL